MCIYGILQKVITGEIIDLSGFHGVQNRIICVATARGSSAGAEPHR